MKTLTHSFQYFCFDQKGAVAVEYALLISCIAVVIAGSVSLFGGTVHQFFRDALSNFPK